MTALLIAVLLTTVWGLAVWRDHKHCEYPIGQDKP